MRSPAAAAILLVLLLGACAKSAEGTTPTKQDAVAATASAPGEGGTSKTDPCELLTKAMAEGALGVAVGPPTQTPAEGTSSCTYAPSDGRPNVFVLLTVYAHTGAAGMVEATKAFRDPTVVPDLGDAAIVSPIGHAIRVSTGDLLFGISLVRPDALDVPPAVGKAQLITLARSVLQSR